MTCLEEWRGIERERLVNEMREMCNRRGTKRTSADEQNVPVQMNKTFSRTLENLNNESKQSKDSLPAQVQVVEVPQPSQTHQPERERFFLDPYRERFTNYEKHRDELNRLVFRYGRGAVLQAIEDCKNGVDWIYVLNRLNRGGAVAPSPSSAVPPSPIWNGRELTQLERLYIQRGYTVEEAVKAVAQDAERQQRKVEALGESAFACVASVEAVRAWGLAWHQLELQFDRSTFDTWLRDAVLRDEKEGVFYVVVRDKYAQNMLQKRLYRRIANVLSDVVGYGCEVVFEAAESASDTPRENAV